VHQQIHEEQIEEVSTSGSDPISAYDSIGDEQEANAHRTRAQKVHSSNTFHGLSSANSASASLMSRMSGIQSAVFGSKKTEEPKPVVNNFLSFDNSASSESSIQSQRKERKPMVVVNEPEVEAKQSSPRNEQAKAAAIITERQVKYLGLVIEKDEEQAVEVGEDVFMPNDTVKR